MATLQPQLPALGAAPVPQSVTLALTGSADVNDATKKAGLSFGKLIETTGLAIADSQRQLNEVGAASTSALASQLVDVIAAQVNAYDDDGNLDATGTKTLPMKLPLMPSAIAITATNVNTTSAMPSIVRIDDARRSERLRHG